MKFGAYLINPPNLPYAAGGRSTEESAARPPA